MKFTLSWLKDHLETDASLDEIAERLTSLGLEVEAIDRQAKLAPFVIARVLDAKRHPDAERLQVLTVDAGPAGAIKKAGPAGGRHDGHGQVAGERPSGPR